MCAAPQVYSPLVWYVVDGTRVAYEVLNRADNPQPDGQHIDSPSYQFIEYAGGGMWRSEEDVAAARDERLRCPLRGRRGVHPQTLQQKLRRSDWGSWVNWASPDPGHNAAPPWLDKAGFRPFAGLQDIDFGVRSH